MLADKVIVNLRIFIILSLLALASCGMEYHAPSALVTKGGIGLSVAGNPTSVEIDEGDNLIIVPTLTQASAEDVEIEVSVSSPRGDLATFFSHTFPIRTTIPAGSTSVVVSLTTDTQPTYTGNLPFTVTLSSPALSRQVNFSLTLKDLQPLTLGNFSVAGIEDAAGSTDTTADAALVDSLVPKLTWSSSSHAEEYLVSVLEDDGTTVKCAVQSASSTSYAFSAGNCSLSIGVYYRARVVAKAGTVENSAALYRFQVQSTAVLAADSILLMSNGSAVTFDPRSNDAETGATITGVSTPTTGTSSFTANSVTFTPDGTSTGVSTFTYSVLNAAGDTVPGTVTVKLMTPFTWTGSVSTNFQTSGNWCGSVSTPGLSGACTGGPAPNSSQVAIIDATCTGSQCNPVISAGASVSLYGLKLGANTLTKAGSATVSIVPPYGSTSVGFIQTGGSFVGGDGNVTVDNGPFTLSAGTFTAPTGVLKVHRQGVTISPGANFQHGGGTFQFSSNWNTEQQISASTSVFNHVQFNSQGDDNFNLISGSLTVTGNMEIMDSNRGHLNGGEIKLSGNLTILGRGHNHGTTKVELIGNPSGQTVHGAAGGGVSGLKLVAGTNPVTFSGSFRLHDASLEVVSVGTFNATGNTLRFGEVGCQQVPIIPGNIEYNHVELLKGCQWYSIENHTMKVGGNFALKNDDYLSKINTGTIEVRGDVDLSTTYGAEGSGRIRLIGNPAGQTITGGARALLPRLEIDAGSNSVTMTNKVGIFGEYKVTSVGTLTPPDELLLDGGCNGYGTGIFTALMGASPYNKLTLAGGCPSFDFLGATVIADDLDIGRGVGSEIRGAFNNGSIYVSGDLTIKVNNGIEGNGVFRLVGNASGQSILANQPNSDLPNLVIDAGANPVTLSGTGNLRIKNDYAFLSGASFDMTGKTLRFGIGNCTGNGELTFGSVTYENLIFDTYCRTLNITDSVMTSGDLSITSSGTVNMPNPGTGYSITVGGSYAKDAAATLNLYGATLTN